MERDIIQEWSLLSRIQITKEKADKLLLFAELIHKANSKFNITGFNTKDNILTELLLKCIEPLSDIIVPRGTRFIDIGSGAGVPGLVLSIFLPNFSGILLDSNNKKAEFIKGTIEILKLENLEVICERAEIVSRNAEFREKFDWCFARAFGKIYVTIELGAPFLKKNGYLYIYSNDFPGNFPVKITEHALKTGLRIMSHEENRILNILDTGLCFKKVSSTPEKFPRRFSVIKREALES